MTGEPAFVAETLAWCNSIRAEKGQPPLDRLPKGKKGDPRLCPCGAATGLYVWPITYDAGIGRTIGLVPPAVGAFVRAFDHGQLPQYVEGYAP